MGPLTRAVLNSLLPTSASSPTTPSTIATTATTTASTTPSLPSWYTKPLPGYAPGQIIFTGGSSPAPAPVAASGTTSSDTVPPTAPSNLTAVAASLSELDLSWTASTDGVGVAGYKIFRGGSQIATSTLTTYADTGLTASTTYTYTVKAYDAAGNISSVSNTAISTSGTWADGFASAPAGTSQYPTFFSGYSIRPPWRVAGVDYAVGPNPGVTLKDPATATLPSGVTRDSTNHLFTVTGSNVTLDGWDFSLEGGWNVIVGVDPLFVNTTATTSSGSVLSFSSTSGISSGMIVGDATNPSGVIPAGTTVLSTTGTTVTLSNSVTGAGVRNGDTIKFWPSSSEAEGQNVTIQNSNFKIGSNLNDLLAFRATTQNAIVRNNTFDGSGVESAFSNEGLIYVGGGNVTIEYNWIKNAVGSLVKDGGGSTALNPVIKYNILENAAVGDPSVHGDWYFPAGPQLYGNMTFQFNTVLQNSLGTSGSDGTDGASFGHAGFNNLTIGGNVDASYNSVLALQDPNHTGRTTGNHTTTGSVFVLDTAQIAGSCTVSNNYVDTSGVGAGGWYQIENTGGPNSCVPTKFGNMNLVTGQPFEDATPPSVSLTVPSNGATVSGSSVTLTATASDNVAVANVQFEVDSTNIASAITSSPYTTTWNSAGVSNGAHTLFAVAKDTSGNYATSSISITVSNAAPYTGPGNIVSGALAWWGLRAYSGATAGTKAVNICRASDSTCTDISTLSNGNLDATTASTFCTSTTCTIKTWYDQSGGMDCSGTACDVTQSTTANQAMLAFNCIGSLPCATGTGSVTYSSANNLTTQAQPFTVSLVFNHTSGNEEYFSSNNDAVQVQSAFAANRCSLYAGAEIDYNSCTDGTWHAGQFVYNGALPNSFTYVDGVQTTGSSGSNQLGNFAKVFFLGGGTAGYYLNGKAEEGGIWPSAFNTTQAGNLNSNQHTYWGF